MVYEEFAKTICRLLPELTEEQMEKFRRMDGLYREWNSKINVISRKDIDELYRHHILHSLAIACYLRAQKPEVYAHMLADGGEEILDLGTGGGFPGIPLAVMFPKVHFTLCDSIGKKITVASEVAVSLGLENVATVNARAESLPGVFDYVVSRAVTSLDNFLPWVKGKYRKSILYLKGGDLVEEIAVAMGRNKLPKGSVGTWPVDSYIRDEYFKEKFVIEIVKK